MNTLLGMTSVLVDVYNEKVEDLGLSPFFRVDKGWKDEEDKVYIAALLWFFVLRSGWYFGIYQVIVLEDMVQRIHHNSSQIIFYD